MKDIQNQSDNRRVDIRKVGVKSVSYPIVVLDKAKRRQHTIASVNMYVHLPHHFKGTHMSRFVEILNECHGEIDFQNFKIILEKMKLRLQAQASHLEMSFPYFLQSDTLPKLNYLPQKYNCILSGSLSDSSDIKFSIEIPVYLSSSTNKDRSRWGYISLDLTFERFYWIEDVITKVEKEIHVVSDLLSSFEPFEAVNYLAVKISDLLSTIDDVANYSIKANHYSGEVTYYTSLNSSM